MPPPAAAGLGAGHSTCWGLLLHGGRREQVGSRGRGVRTGSRKHQARPGRMQQRRALQTVVPGQTVAAHGPLGPIGCGQGGGQLESRALWSKSCKPWVWGSGCTPQPVGHAGVGSTRPQELEPDLRVLQFGDGLHAAAADWLWRRGQQWASPMPAPSSSKPRCTKLSLEVARNMLLGRWGASWASVTLPMAMTSHFWVEEQVQVNSVGHAQWQLPPQGCPQQPRRQVESCEIQRPSAELFSKGAAARPQTGAVPKGLLAELQLKTWGLWSQTEGWKAWHSIGKGRGNAIALHLAPCSGRWCWRRSQSPVSPELCRWTWNACRTKPLQCGQQLRLPQAWAGKSNSWAEACTCTIKHFPVCGGVRLWQWAAPQPLGHRRGKGSQRCKHAHCPGG